MEESLILKIRVEALHANLAKVNRYLDTVPNKKADLEDLLKLLEEIRTDTSAAKIKLTTSTETLRQDSNAAQFGWVDTSKALERIVVSIQERVMPELEKSAEVAEEALKRIGAAQAMVGKMKGKCFPIGNDVIGESFKGDVRKRTDELQNLKNTLQRIPAEANLWEKYRRQRSEADGKIFAEYAEFLGGLALRDAGFDAGISLVADELIRTYKSEPDPGNLVSLLAIPARQEAEMMTLARIIRVRFPEWTIWALPFTAREFWHVVAQKDLESKLTEEIADEAKSNDPEAIEPRFREALADAFGTFTMGPAYAYSAICLLLDPFKAFTGGSGQVADDTRAHAIFQMLECMDRKGTGADTPPYEKTRTSLEKAWEAAIKQANPLPSEELRGECAKDELRIKTMVEALWRVLDEGNCAPFLISHWNAIQTWPAELLKGKVNSIQIPAGAEWRHVLNAVWLARVDPNRKPKLDITAVAQLLADSVRFPVGKESAQKRGGASSANAPDLESATQQLTQSPKLPRGALN